ncbi:MAG: nuclear transport factor 2 family protein [Ktedonobacterales bacterium]
MAVNTAHTVVDQYFAALTRKDWATLQTLLHDDLSFKGPLATLDKADEYLQGLERITARMTGMERRITLTEGENVLQVYDVTLAAPEVTVPVAEWLQVRDDRIASIQMFLDPRPFVVPPAS